MCNVLSHLRTPVVSDTNGTNSDEDDDENDSDYKR